MPVALANHDVEMGQMPNPSRLPAEVDVEELAAGLARAFPDDTTAAAAKRAEKAERDAARKANIPLLQQQHVMMLQYNIISPDAADIEMGAFQKAKLSTQQQTLSDNDEKLKFAQHMFEQGQAAAAAAAEAAAAEATAAQATPTSPTDGQLWRNGSAPVETRKRPAEFDLPQRSNSEPGTPAEKRAHTHTHVAPLSDAMRAAIERLANPTPTGRAAADQILGKQAVAMVERQDELIQAHGPLGDKCLYHTRFGDLASECTRVHSLGTGCCYIGYERLLVRLDDPTDTDAHEFMKQKVVPLRSGRKDNLRLMSKGRQTRSRRNRAAREAATRNYLGEQVAAVVENE